MASILSQLTSTTPRTVAGGELRCSFFGKELHRRAEMRRSYSENHLCCSVSSTRAFTAQIKLKTSRSIGFFNIHLSSGMIPDTLRSFLFDPERSKEANTEKNYESDHDEAELEPDTTEGPERANWIERWVELRNSWKGKLDKVEDYGDGDGESCAEEGGCQVEYEEDEGRDITIDT